MKRIYTLTLILALGALLIPQRWVSFGAPNVSGSMFRLIAEPQRQEAPERLVGLSQLDTVPLADAGDSPLGRDPRRWRELLASKVNQRFQEVFPGVDLVFAGSRKRMEAVLIVKPGVDPASIRFDFPQAEAIGADAQGNIWVAMPGGDLGFMRPILTRQNEKVSGSFAVQESRVVLQVQDHDAAQPLLVRFDIVFPERAVNLLDQILYRTFKAENHQPTSPASPEQATTVTATKAVDLATVAPGGTLMYTVTVTNTGATTANGVQFTDTISNNTTLVGGSIASSPIGANDTYTATGNIPIAPSAGVLANDVDPDTGNNTGLTVTQVQGVAGNVGNATNTTAAGFGGVNGSVTVLSNGSFTYEPPPGFTGSDTFTYRVADAGGKFNDATVTITVSNMVWFIDNTAGGSLNRGTFSHPFTNIANFNTANTGAALRPAAGHHIVLSPAGGTYNEADGINLLNNQTLTGAAVAFNTVFSADANSTVAYTTFAASVGAAPTINSTGGNAVDLAMGNAVRGLNVGNTPGFFGFNGTAVGSLTIATVSKTGTGGAINVSTSGAFGSNVTFTTLASSSSPGPNINLVNVTGTLGVTSGGTGLSGSAASSAAIDIAAGSVSMTYPGNVTKSNAGSLLHVSISHTGTLTFNTGTLNASAGDGLQFDNADGTYNFNGTTTLNGGDAGVDIINGSGGTFSFGTGAAITSPTGIAFNVDGTGAPVTASVTYSGNITQANNATLVNVKNHTTGTITFQTGTLNASNGTGLQFDNADGTYNFNGTTTLNGGDAGVDIINGSAGTFSFTSGASITNPSGTSFNVASSTANVTYAGTITDDVGTVVSVSSETAGSIAFTGAITDGDDGDGSGFSLTGNTGATITFRGGVVLNTGANAAFTATGGGTINVCDENVCNPGATGALINKLTTTTGTALNVANTIIGANKLEFRSIAAGTGASGPANGIVLNTTGSLGGLTVAGTGAADSGGIIQRTTGSGILATDTQDLSLTRIRIDTPGNHGIEATNLRGTCLLSNSTIIDFALATGNGFKILNTSTNLTLLTISGSTFNGTATGNAGVSMEAAGTSNMTLSIEASCVFTDMFGDGVQALTQTGFTGTISATVKNSTFNTAAAVGNGGIFMAPFGGPGTFNFDIDGNSFSDIMRPLTNLGAINITDGDLDGGGPTVNGQVRNNTLNNIVGSRGIVVIADTFAGPLDLTIDNNNIDRLQSTSKHAINVGVRNSVTNADVRITNNDIGQAAALWTAGPGTAEAILVLTQDAASANVLLNGNVIDANATLEVMRVRAIGTSTMNATITANDLNDTNTTHIELAAVTASGTPTMCANISGNVLPGGAVGVIQLTESAGTLNVVQASAAAVAAANSGATVTVTGAPTFGAPACTLPTFAPIETDEQKAARQSNGNDSAMVSPELRQWLDQVFFKPVTLADYFKFTDKQVFATLPAEAVTAPRPQSAPPTEGGGASHGTIGRTIGQVARPVLSAFATSISYINPLNLFERSADAASPDITRDETTAKQPATLSAQATQDRPQRPQRTEGRTEAPQRQQPKPPTRILASPESGETVMVGPFNLPAGESVQIMFSVTVTGTTGCSISNQGSVMGSNFSPVTTNAAVTTILQAPSAITCPANIVGTTDTGLCTSVETFATPTTSAGCPVPTVTCAPPSGTAFVVGTTTVTCTATNSQGSTMCTFTVTVTDAQLPVLTCPSPIMANTAAGVCTAAVSYTTTITDNCPGATFSCLPASGSTFALGVTTVNCTGMDVNGNAAVPCSFTVTVADNQNPVIGACPTNISIPATSGACSATATFTTPTATDNCTMPPTVTCSPASGSTFSVGTTTVTCTAKDAANNMSMCTFTVTVNDTQNPVPTCPANQSVSSNVPIAVNYPAATVTDNCPNPTINCVPASGSTFVVGTTTVTCTATDASNNMATCTFTVSVVPCTINCPVNQTATAAVGTCAATVSYPAPTTTGTCGTVTCVPASGASFNVGVTTVTCSTTAGPSCTFTVTVSDTELPVLGACPSNITTPATSGACAAAVTFTNPTVTDNCAGVTVTCTPASGGSFPVGTTTVSCKATDASNNMSAPCTFTVTVQDTQNPALTCPANISQPAPGGTCAATVTYTTPTATDNCPNPTVTCSPASGASFPVGTTTVTCTATDASNNMATCTFTVTITDTQNPTLTCPANITQPATTGACSAVVTYTVPTASDNCPGATVACVPNTGSTFNVGTTTVTCTATDASNNTGTCTFTVTVNDTQPPVITCPANQTVSSNVPIAVNYPAPTVTDNCPNPTVNCVPASGSTFVVGTTTVTCTATDASNNMATCTFTVSVVPCTITCPVNQTATAAAGQCAATVNYPAPTTTGTCGTVTCVPASGASFPVGVTTVTCSTSAGPSCSFTVTVTDTQLPVLGACPANITNFPAANGTCAAAVTFTNPTVTDNCPGATVTCTPASGSSFAVGTTTVSCKATDASNNMSAPCTFTVQVVDNQLPVLGACPANITQTAPSGQCAATVTFTNPTVTDNCPGATVTCTPASGSSFAVGTTTVSCKATDASNNMSAPCTFTVTINDTELPVLGACPANITNFPAANGACAANVTFTNPTVTDNCPGATVTCTPASGSSFTVGTTTVSCKATDASNNMSAPCTFTVQVVDTQNPTITCPANQTATSLGGPIAVTYPAPTATDNCPGVTTACVPASGSIFALGTTTVTCTATDASARTATCSFTVTVITCTSITCPSDIFVGTTGNSSVVTYSLPVANGNCGTITCTPASGSAFNVGVTTVSCSSSIGNQTCAFNVTVNRVGGTVIDPLACTGPGNTVQATLVITNNGNVNQTVADTTTFTNLVGVPNTCTVSPNVGTCTVTNGGLTYTGTLTPGQTVTLTYLTQVSDLAPTGAQVCTNNSVTFNGGAPFAFSVCDIVDCPVAGPGLPFPARSEASDQSTGSVLIYNIYTSSSSAPNSQNTRVSLTNVHPTLPANVHLFFVDGASCSIADSYVCLTGSQTTSFLMSDLDPGTTGYIVAVATDSRGCPINFNYLIGDEYVKFASGHASNLGAQAFSAIPGGLVSCDQNSVTATLNFDGVSYDRTPRTLALDSIGSKADGNDTMLILNRIGGNLGTGASTLSAIFGIFYDDSENSVSFSIAGGCQLRGSISNNLPRITPRFETFIPAGRTGWMRFFSQSDIGITGAAINFNPNSVSSAGAFNQGHNLHVLTLSGAASYVIPVFPPSC